MYSGCSVPHCTIFGSAEQQASRTSVAAAAIAGAHLLVRLMCLGSEAEAQPSWHKTDLLGMSDAASYSLSRKQSEVLI